MVDRFDSADYSGEPAQQLSLPAEGADDAYASFLTPVNVQSALFFEPPEEIFRRVHRELRPRSPVPAVRVAFQPFANANSDVRLANHTLQFRISDVLQEAPAPVLEALAHILIGKLYRRPAAAQYVHRYRLYLNRKDIRKKIGAVQQERGRKVHKGPAGIIHNLEEVFEEINARHFGGMMARPALGWSHVRSRTRLGHFDPAHNMIMISRIFDDWRTPKLALEYVMFHEMLHLHYPVKHGGARRSIHTREFRAHEKLFPGIAEARAILKKLK